MRALLAILLYGLAAFGGLAAGYYATAPGAAAGQARAERAHRHAPGRELAEMEAAAGFLEREEQRAAGGAARRASSDL